MIMSAGSTKHSVPQRNNMPVFGSYNGSQASLRLEKSNPGLRRSTPDSEALASSDEELDHVRTRGQTKPVNPTRRTFSYADHSTVHRKPSMTASGSYSPSTSTPGTPAAEQHPWPTMSPSTSTWGSGSSGYPWTGSIWSHESRKEPPARLQEVHPNEANNEIPFSIPLQPTIKTYRSQSYSVGQMDPSHSGLPPGNGASSMEQNRARAIGQFPALQRRSSRPGMMGAGGDVGSLSGVREDDDEETLDVTQRNVEQAREIERLEQENARLRAEQRQRTMSSTASMQLPPSFRSTQIRGAVPEEGDLAIDDQDDGAAFASYHLVSAGNRRYSEQLQHPDRQPMSPSEHRLSRWQTASGTPRLSDIPQSRRHSFAADAPTRHGSFGSQDAESTGLYDRDGQDFPVMNDPVYFKLDEKRRLEAEASVQQGLSYTNIYPYGSYSGPGQTFLIVNFKCCRSDIFYIQEGTGLQVQVGDLVVVDADRGTDLGAVQHVNVSLEEARRYKEYYAEEHYKLLMMFSQQTKNGGMNAVNPNGPPARQSTVGGMGPHAHGHREGHGDPKAKMIKRLAQAHEIQALKEKEGNEAKAKRVCSSKVVEHNLNMEILDAEFQMDNKKLTFYYFADEYINFNALVTDLFKIYKTRIWMSAINPASFQTPTSSLGIGPAYGSNGMSVPTSDTSRMSSYTSAGGSMVSPYENSRDMRTRGVMPAPYYPSYQGQPALGHRLGSDMNGFAGTAPPAIDPFSPYSAQGFGMFNQAGPAFGIPRQDSRSSNSNQSPNPNWISQFQGLSMGS